MSPFVHNSGRISRLGRATAVLVSLVVGVLLWLAADPVAHAWMHADRTDGACHGHEHGSHDDSHTGRGAGEAGCVVTAFAHGQVVILGAVLWSALPIQSPVAVLEIGEKKRVARIDCALPPACGPPVA